MKTHPLMIGIPHLYIRHNNLVNSCVYPEMNQMGRSHPQHLLSTQTHQSDQRLSLPDKEE